MATVFTIGFTNKSLRQFVETLRAAGVQRVVDVRLRNTSQLAGWTKLPDFAYLLEEGFSITCEHHPEFAPSGEILDKYKSSADCQREVIEQCSPAGIRWRCCRLGAANHFAINGQRNCCPA